MSKYKIIKENDQLEKGDVIFKTGDGCKYKCDGCIGNSNDYCLRSALELGYVQKINEEENNMEMKGKWESVDGLVVEGLENLRKVLKELKNYKLAIFNISAFGKDTYMIHLSGELCEDSIPEEFIKDIMFFNGCTYTASKVMDKFGVKKEKEHVYYVDRRYNRLIKSSIKQLTDYFSYENIHYPLSNRGSVIDMPIDGLAKLKFQKFVQENDL